MIIYFIMWYLDNWWIPYHQSLSGFDITYQGKKKKKKKKSSSPCYMLAQSVKTKTQNMRETTVALSFNLDDLENTVRVREREREREGGRERVWERERERVHTKPCWSLSSALWRLLCILRSSLSSHCLVLASCLAFSSNHPFSLQNIFNVQNRTKTNNNKKSALNPVSL